MCIYDLAAEVDNPVERFMLLMVVKRRICKQPEKHTISTPEDRIRTIWEVVLVEL